jgi:hypothetical protein
MSWYEGLRGRRSFQVVSLRQDACVTASIPSRSVFITIITISSTPNSALPNQKNSQNLLIRTAYQPLNHSGLPLPFTTQTP